jgi:hypothetical protein
VIPSCWFRRSEKVPNEFLVEGDERVFQPRLIGRRGAGTTEHFSFHHLSVNCDQLSNKIQAGSF